MKLHESLVHAADTSSKAPGVVQVQARKAILSMLSRIKVVDLTDEETNAIVAARQAFIDLDEAKG